MAQPVTSRNFASRNRKHQSEYRKHQLIEATMDCIDQLGISQTTLARIAERASISQGNVVFHFQNKETLLEQTLRHLSDEYHANWLATLDAAGDTAYARLLALIEASFNAKICNRRKISVWYAFWGESRSRPAYMRVCGSNDQAFSDQVVKLCRQLEIETDARLDATSAALSIEGTIDGLWQNFLIGPRGFKRKQAFQAVVKLVDVIYPGMTASGTSNAPNSRE